ncbi:expressed unknown protein [Seminavis robusta]|uniref:Uncharacterized protein n=1 Tax=Seminavis robusta TaxID=568900 RepID=A0A9N8HDW0_9STRA|nr:expressed unknown protein [Seminavis robusta]|eukprot:Sro274_g105560.1 n/a (432) ;mRNA; f:68985-70280
MMRALSKATSVLIALAFLTVDQALSQARTTCRKGAKKQPHLKDLWQQDFPNDLEVEALCEGTITVMDDGEICIDGRVTYGQLADALGTPVRQPSNPTISITGHLISGSGSVFLGMESNFLYDFVTSYSVGSNSNIPAGPNMTDDLLAASRGQINGVCLDKTFTQPEEFYAVTHDFWIPKNAKEDKFAQANAIYVSRYSIVAEYWQPTNVAPFFGTILSTVTNLFETFLPSWIYQYVPLLGFTGIQRLLVVGSLSSAQFPVAIPIFADLDSEDYGIDTEWDTLMSAMEDGLFTKDTLPLYFGVLIRKVSAGTEKSCWSVPIATIDIYAPKGSGDQLNKFIKETVVPYLKSRGNVGLHFGKRLDSGSELLSLALSTYNRQCGVELGVTPTEGCYHPACNRESTLTNFTWPPSLYQPAKQMQSRSREDKRCSFD